MDRKTMYELNAVRGNTPTVPMTVAPPLTYWGDKEPTRSARVAPWLTKPPTEQVSPVLSAVLEDGEWHTARYDVETETWRLVPVGQKQMWKDMGFFVSRIRSVKHAR